MKIYLPLTEEVEDLLDQIKEAFPQVQINSRQMIEIETDSKPAAAFFNHLAELNNPEKPVSNAYMLDDERTCKRAGCGKIFHPTSGNQKYCELHAPHPHRKAAAKSDNAQKAAVAQ